MSTQRKIVLVMIPILAGLFIFFRNQRGHSSVSGANLESVKVSANGRLSAQVSTASSGSVGSADAQASSAKVVSITKTRPARTYTYATTITRRLNADGNPLHLAAEQIENFQLYYNGLVAARLEAEADSAITNRTGPDGSIILIKSYPEEGQIMHDTFYEALRADFGPELTKQIEATYGDVIASENMNYGQVEQRISVTAQPSNMFAIEHQIKSATGLVVTRNSQLEGENLDAYTLLSKDFPQKAQTTNN